MVKLKFETHFEVKIGANIEHVLILFRTLVLFLYMSLYFLISFRVIT
jgi:hypothetical protein